MRWLVVCALILGGCRQLIGIDDPSVSGGGDDGGPADGTAGGHDEDLDEVPDSLDNCPSVANKQQGSTDGKLGSACDPRPTTAGDKIALFVPFYPMGAVPSLQIDSSAALESDHVRLSGQQLQTGASFLATRVSASLALVTFQPPDAFVSVELGQHRCSIEGCSGSGTFCLVARAVGVTSEVDLPIAGVATLEMDQIASEVVCRVGAVEAQAFTSAPLTNKVKVRTQSATVQVDSLTIYDIGS